MENDKNTQKSLDIYDLIAIIKRSVYNSIAVTVNDKPYFGKVTIHFEGGKITHCEKVETMK